MNTRAAILSVMFAMVLSFAIIRMTEEPGTGYDLAGAAETPVICMDAETEDKIRVIMYEALDNALKDHFERMFKVWMGSEEGQPERARNGVQNGISAWQRARQDAQKWRPFRC
jgi:hypothetical protein